MQHKNLTRRNRRIRSKFKFNLIDRRNKQLSSELHDSVSSKLSVVRFKLLHSSEKSVEVIGLLDNIIENVREISHGLYSPTIEYVGLIDAIRDFLSPLHRAINIKIYNLHEYTYKINKKTELFLFRIFQEVINNVLKHSRADNVSVYIRFSKKNISILIKDNGVGFLYNSINKKGIGLKNIKYRAKKLKASYKFKTEINKGTRFIISAPICKK